LRMFSEMTPPPGADGGLANAILGSALMSFIAVAAGTPLGLLAGTYLAEYGRYGRTAFFVRFINDILLSAPSIVTGLFIYEILVLRMALLGVGGCGFAYGHRDSGGGAHDGEHAPARTQRTPRGRRCSGRAA